MLLSGLMFNADYYITIIPYDAFGLDETIPSNEIHVHTPFLDVEAIAEGVLKDSQLIPALKRASIWWTRPSRSSARSTNASRMRRRSSRAT